MARINLLTATAVCLALVLNTSGSPVGSQKEIPDGLEFVGATETKELYISNSNITGDFSHSLVIGCPLRFQMTLARIETAEEVALLDSYFTSTEGNSSNPAWTSGIDRIGLIPAQWASSGMQVGNWPANISGPWPSGAGSSPAYAKHNCVSIRRVCRRYPNAPPGCFPAATEFSYNLCDNR